MLYEFTVSVLTKDVEGLVEKLMLHGYEQTYYNQPIEPFVEPHGYGYIEKQDESVDLMIYVDVEQDLEEIRQNIGAVLQCDLDSIQVKPVDQENWQVPFYTIDLNNGWYIKPPSIEEVPQGNIIHFEPPCAFGSGLHGTTQDCLRTILAYDFTGERILDLGTGSGLLSIAAALKGANEAVAVDIEEVKSEVMYNARLNGVEDQVNVYVTDVLADHFHVGTNFDWIFVNIGGHEIQMLEKFLHNHLRKDGYLLLSGMVEWNVKDIVYLFEKEGYNVLTKNQSEEWVTVLLKKFF